MCDVRNFMEQNASVTKRWGSLAVDCAVICLVRDFVIC